MMHHSESCCPPGLLPAGLYTKRASLSLSALDSPFLLFPLSTYSVTQSTHIGAPLGRCFAVAHFNVGVLGRSDLVSELLAIGAIGLGGYLELLCSPSFLLLEWLLAQKQLTFQPANERRRRQPNFLLLLTVSSSENESKRDMNCE